MTGPESIWHYGEIVTLSDIGAPVESNETHDCAEFTEGCMVCFVGLPLGEQIRRNDERLAEKRRRNYGCTVKGCMDVVVQGHVCDWHERRTAS